MLAQASMKDPTSPSLHDAVNGNNQTIRHCSTLRRNHKKPEDAHSFLFGVQERTLRSESERI